MSNIRDEFLSEEDLDLSNMTEEELYVYWNLWLEQAQATNDMDEKLYCHGVFVCELDRPSRLVAEHRTEYQADTPDAS